MNDTIEDVLTTIINISTDELNNNQNNMYHTNMIINASKILKYIHENVNLIEHLEISPTSSPTSSLTSSSST